MKVLIIIPSFYPAFLYGGPIFSTFFACKELAKIDGVSVYVSTTNANVNSRLDVVTNRWIEKEGFTVKYYNETIIGKFSVPFIWGMAKDIRSADVVHIQSIFSVSTVVSLFYAKLHRKPIVLSPRGQLGGWCLSNGNRFKKAWLNLLIRPFLKNVTWHVTSAQEKAEVGAVFKKAVMVIISNGINLSGYDDVPVLLGSSFFEKYSSLINVESRVVISMGRLQKKKGFDILIKAIPKLKKKDVFLFIAGPDEGERDNLLTLISDLKLSKNVFLVGNVKGDEKLKFLANADVFALPSHNENFGNVYLESLAAGTPIVASTNTPWSEVNSAGCGIWTDNSVESTYKAIEKLLARDRKILREKSIKYASSFDWKEIAEDFVKIYKTLK